MKNKYIFSMGMLLGILAVSFLLTAAYRIQSGENKSSSKAEGDDAFFVVTSFYPMYIAAQNIIGDTDGVELANLSEPQTGCLHDFQMTPEDMRLLSKADVFVINGGGIETFMADVAASYPELAVVNACENVTLSGDNAHAWMSVPKYCTQVETIAQKLMEYDPAHAEVYKENRDRYLEKLTDLILMQEDLKDSLDGAQVILLHEAYEYLAMDLGLFVCGTLNLDEETSVSAGDAAELVDRIKEGGVRFVLAEERYGSDMGELLASETDAAVLYLDTLNRGDYDADSYIDGMRANIRMLCDGN